MDINQVHDSLNNLVFMGTVQEVFQPKLIVGYEAESPRDYPPDYTIQVIGRPGYYPRVIRHAKVLTQPWYPHAGAHHHYSPGDVVYGIVIQGSAFILGKAAGLVEGVNKITIQTPNTIVDNLAGLLVVQQRGTNIIGIPHGPGNRVFKAEGLIYPIDTFKLGTPNSTVAVGKKQSTAPLTTVLSNSPFVKVNTNSAALMGTGAYTDAVQIGTTQPNFIFPSGVLTSALPMYYSPELGPSVGDTVLSSAIDSWWLSPAYNRTWNSQDPHFTLMSSNNVNIRINGDTKTIQIEDAHFGPGTPYRVLAMEQFSYILDDAGWLLGYSQVTDTLRLYTDDPFRDSSGDVPGTDSRTPIYYPKVTTYTRGVLKSPSDSEDYPITKVGDHKPYDDGFGKEIEYGTNQKYRPDGVDFSVDPPTYRYPLVKNINVPAAVDADAGTAATQPETPLTITEYASLADASSVAGQIQVGDTYYFRYSTAEQWKDVGEKLNTKSAGNPAHVHEMPTHSHFIPVNWVVDHAHIAEHYLAMGQTHIEVDSSMMFPRYGDDQGNVYMIHSAKDDEPKEQTPQKLTTAQWVGTIFNSALGSFYSQYETTYLNTGQISKIPEIASIGGRAGGFYATHTITGAESISIVTALITEYDSSFSNPNVPTIRNKTPKKAIITFAQNGLNNSYISHSGRDILVSSRGLIQAEKTGAISSLATLPKSSTEYTIPNVHLTLGVKPGTNYTGKLSERTSAGGDFTSRAGAWMPHTTNKRIAVLDIEYPVLAQTDIPTLIITSSIERGKSRTAKAGNDVNILNVATNEKTIYSELDGYEIKSVLLVVSKASWAGYWEIPGAEVNAFCLPVPHDADTVAFMIVELHEGYEFYFPTES